MVMSSSLFGAAIIPAALLFRRLSVEQVGGARNRNLVSSSPPKSVDKKTLVEAIGHAAVRAVRWLRGSAAGGPLGKIAAGGGYGGVIAHVFEDGLPDPQ
jgi:hypothetical protein